MVDYRLSKLEAIQKPTQMVFVCDLPAIIKGGPISRRTARVAPKAYTSLLAGPSNGFRHVAAARCHRHRDLGSDRDCARVCGARLALDDPHTD
jgi:hypothetical protein